MNSPMPGFSGSFWLTRRAWLGAALLLGAARTAGAAPVTLPAAKSLRDELALALKSGNPLVVLVSLDGCPFCKTVREHYLSPMREQEGLAVVQVLSLIHISEPTRRTPISYAVFCLKKKK